MNEKFWTARQEELERIYGSGDPKLFNQISVETEREVAMVWSAIAGMPKPESFIGYHADSEKGKGLKWVNERFEKVMTVTQIIWEHSLTNNAWLYEDLTQPTGRRNDIIVDENYEPQSVPKKHPREITPTSTPAGWAAPRVLLLLIEDENFQIVKPIEETFKVLDESIIESRTGAIFLATLSGKVHNEGVDAIKIIDLVLKHHILREQNNIEMYFDVIDYLTVRAPDLYKAVIAEYERTNKVDDLASGWVKILNRYFDRRNSQSEIELVDIPF